MPRQSRLALALSGLALLTLTACSPQSADPATVATDGPAGAYRVPRTSWGDPDLQGTWPGTAMVGVPLQRDERLGARNVLTDEEFAAREAQFARQDEADNAEFEFGTTDLPPPGAVGSATSPPPHWLERGEPQRQASLIIDPPNGRFPPLTPQAEQRRAALRAYEQSRGPADSYTDRSLYDRCITRGLAGSMQPAIYNAGNLIVQSPGYVTVVNEMIHEARIVPLDGRQHVGSGIKQWLGNSRGRWEGDVLVIETTNFTNRTSVGATEHSEALKITERFARVDDDTLEYTMTVDDPETWTAPWTWQMALERDDGYEVFEYACHEGNRALANILSGARAEERAAAAATNR